MTEIIKTIGLRISEEAYATLSELSGKILSDVQMEYGLDITNGSTLLRFAISNLVSNPPNSKNIPNIVISCKNDDTFDAYLSSILEEKK